ncbi:MAG TPA: 50S ribosomal protein L3 [Candidatus Woesebacteria bacterium]|nr:50S ribosomal protein L3 [Candidatus Woesebacteria bacterium]
MNKQVYATKKSMTQTFVEGKRIPLTVLSVDPHTVISQKTIEKDGYSATVLAIGTKKKANKPLSGKLKKLGLENTPKYIREVSIEEAENFDLSSILTPGSTVNVTAVSKGKGTSGVMKRWGMHGGPRTHGQSDRSRAPGSIGRGTTPGRVVKGKHMAGHMGAENVTIKNLKVHSFDAATGTLQITGAIPGFRGSLTKITITKNPNN